MSVPVAVACVAVTVIVGGSCLAAGQHVVRAAEARAAADAAALAAADAALGWIDADPCALADRIAESFETRLVTCTVDEAGGDAVVEVRASTAVGAASARARAGPPAE